MRYVPLIQELERDDQDQQDGEPDDEQVSSPERLGLLELERTSSRSCLAASTGAASSSADGTTSQSMP